MKEQLLLFTIKTDGSLDVRPLDMTIEDFDSQKMKCYNSKGDKC